MSTTTVTTEPPPTLPDAVRARIRELSDRNVRTFTAGDFAGVALRAGRPESWLEDHLLVLEGIGILRHVLRPGPRAWAASPGTEYLR